MTPELKRKWIDALRSGTYTQGKHRLKFTSHNPDDPTVYCCLGVLGCVMGVVLDNEDQGDVYGERYDFVRDALGEQDILNVLTGLNDIHGRSFAQIADYIEANL